jgi:ribosomal protein S18 acetylase RimI-like enzyme
MRIRKAHRRDAAAIATLHAASWRSAYRGLLPARRLGPELDRNRQRHWRTALATARPRDVVLLAEAENRTLGFIAVWVTARSAYIDNLHVEPGARGRRIGEALMREAARRLVARGVRQAALWAFVANRPAIGFYNRLGGEANRRSFREFPPATAPCQRLTWRRLEALR